MNFSEKIKRLCRTSVILSALMTVIPKLYQQLADGLFGRIFTAYSAEERLLHRGKLGIFYDKRTHLSMFWRSVRQRLSEMFERSLLISFFMNAFRYLLGCSLRFYGTFFLTYGGYTVLVYLIKLYANVGVVEVSDLIVGLVIMVVALPMLLSGMTLASLLQKSFLTEWILSDVCGIPQEKLELRRVVGGGKLNMAVVIGMIGGALTFLISPLYVIGAIAVLIAVSIIMNYPEIGIIAVFGFLPVFLFLDVQSVWLILAIILAAVAYWGKLMRGKRIFRLTLLDLLIVVFLGILLFGGISTMGMMDSFRQALAMCLMMLMYFMVVNLMRTPAWLKRIAVIFSMSACVTAVAGVSAVLFESEKASGVFGTYLSGAFDTPERLATFMVLAFPVCFATVMSARKLWGKLVGAAFLLVMTACLYLTGLPIAWMGFAVSLVIFLLIYSQKTLCWLLIGGMTVPIWWPFIPSSFIRHITGITQTTFSSAFQQVMTWKGSLNMIRHFLLGGVGYGDAAFQKVYSLYDASRIEGVSTTGSTCLSLMASVGVMGLVVFLCIVLLFVQHCFEYVGNALDTYSRTYVAAGLSAVIGAFFMSVFTDIWQEKTLFLMFWTVLALTSAFIRTGNVIRSRSGDVAIANSNSASVDLSFED